MRTEPHKSEKFHAFFIALAIGLALCFSAKVTHAGFQWVPPSGQEPARTTESVPPAAAASPDAVDQMVLPMPGDASTVPQIDAGEAALNAPAQAGLPSPQTLQLPPGYASQPVQTQTPAPEENVLKVKTLSPAVSNAPALPMPEDIAPSPVPAEMEPVALQPVPPPTAMESPIAPPVVNTKVIMPQDAPQTALDQTPNSQRLTINPFPGQQPAVPAVPATDNPVIPAPAPIQDSNFAVVEGFGSDMPLAIALQQIVPADYAYSFGTNVNAGQTVSWEGGKAWNLILTDMLSPHGLVAVIQGKVIQIRQSGQKQSALVPAEQPVPLEEDIRRANIKDPGEESQIQATNILAGIESAAGTEAIAPTQEEKAAAQTSDNTPSTTQWTAKAGESLKEVLTRWSTQAGVELIWMASYDYQLKDDFAAQESFGSAVDSIVKRGVDEGAAPSLQVEKSAENKTPASLIIKDKTA